MCVDNIRMPTQPYKKHAQREKKSGNTLKEKMKTDVGHPSPMALDTRIR